MFKDYKDNAGKYITFVESDFYPDYLSEASELYSEPLSKFRELVFLCNDSSELLLKITDLNDTNLRIQLLRIFRKYISPDTSVEMLKRKKKIPDLIDEFGFKFRELSDVKKIIYKENEIDPVLVALLFEYKDRGKKGYELTERFFEWFEANFTEYYTINGPIRAGKDILLSEVLEGMEKKVPADFVIFDKKTNEVKAVGFARYDSDRGGAQEDDRISGNRDKITIINEYNTQKDRQIKVIFLNDGPGLLLGSMWDDYVEIENYGKGIAIVSTLKMLDERLTKDWIG
ncbi:TPA: hypothetical protein VV491_001804 [Streptococcus pneumoniae]|nr:hypothetical protein [Streptococcus pneumoniae]